MPLRKASEIKRTDEEKAVLERYLRRRINRGDKVYH